jgi:flavin-dependent dehydrogenase
MAHDFDVIVVGARCAGAPTAMLLARQGYSVLAVDRARFPSDTLSTLVIHGRGVAALRRWGLLDRVAATGCPPIDRYVFNFGPFAIEGTPRPCDGIATAYAPRRTVLDAHLVGAARDAGAEVLEGFTVDEVLIEDGTLLGIRGHGDDGNAVTARARVVVGADGWNSVVARAVAAERYHAKPVLENAFYTFWRGLSVDAFTTVLCGDKGMAVIPTNDDLHLVLVGCPFAHAREFRRNLDANYLATIDLAGELVPDLAGQLRAAERVERIVGGGVPNFFRTPFGPGWALVGDAGYTKDPVTAQGISDAFLSAEWCAAALHDTFTGRRGYDDAMGEYQQRRDRGAMSLYEFTTRLATLEPPPPEMQQLLASIAGNQQAMDDFVSVNAGTLSPEELFVPPSVEALAGAD